MQRIALDETKAEAASQCLANGGLAKWLTVAATCRPSLASSGKASAEFRSKFVSCLFVRPGPSRAPSCWPSSILATGPRTTGRPLDWYDSSLVLQRLGTQPRIFGRQVPEIMAPRMVQTPALLALLAVAVVFGEYIPAVQAVLPANVAARGA